MTALGLALAVLVGVSLGLLGGGGSILTLPILVYAFGMEERAAIATSLVVVGVTSAVALIPHASRGHVDWRTGALFAAAGSAGAFLGGWLAGFVPGPWLFHGFLLMMVATALAMLRGRKELAASPPARSPLLKVLLEGLGVGLITGLVGAGGGFLVVPALVLLGGLPMQRAVGTSLVVISVKSLFGYLGHATHVSIDPFLAAEVSAAAVVGSVLGGLLAPRVPAAALRKGFGGFVLVMAVFLAVRSWT
jgi:uncharacterized membrane protein YfcA